MSQSRKDRRKSVRFDVARSRRVSDRIPFPFGCVEGSSESSSVPPHIDRDTIPSEETKPGAFRRIGTTSSPRGDTRRRGKMRNEVNDATHGESSNPLRADPRRGGSFCKYLLHKSAPAKWSRDPRGE